MLTNIEDKRVKEVRVATLQAAIQKAEELARAQAASNPGLMGLVNDLQDFAKAAAAVVGAPVTENYPAAVGSLPSLYTSFEKLRSSYIVAPNTDLIPALKEQLAIAARELEDFAIFLSNSRTDYLSDHEGDLMSILNARAAVESFRQTEAFLEPLTFLKVCLISYFEDVSRTKARLINNLNLLAAYLQEFPNKNPNGVNISEIEWTCTGSNSACKTVAADNEHWRLLSANVDISGKMRELPLLVIAPRASS